MGDYEVERAFLRVDEGERRRTWANVVEDGWLRVDGGERDRTWLTYGI